MDAVKFSRNLAESFSQIIQDWIMSLGKRTLPLVAGTIFALGLYDFFLGLTSDSTSATLCIVGLIIGMESVGFQSFSKAFESFAENSPDWVKAITIVASLTYILVGGCTLFLTDAHRTHKILVLGLYIIVACNNSLLGWDIYIQRKKERVSEGKARKLEDDLAYVVNDVEKKKVVDNYRREKKKKDAESFQKVSESSDTGEKVSETQRRLYTHWRQVSADDKKLINDMSIGQIVSEFGTSEKTAGNWKKYATRDLVRSNGHGVE